MFNELYGEPVKQAITEKLIESVNAFKAGGVNPKLVVIRAGENPGQLYYEEAIIRASQNYGIETQVISFNSSVSQAYLEAALSAVNVDEEVHGIILLRPFPEHIDEEALRHMLSPEKDVDAITDISIAQAVVSNKDTFYSCTAEACIELMKYYGIEIEGKKVTVVGRSLTVGKPLSIMLMNMNATVTICHSKTPEEDQIAACRNADIVILATGKTQHFGPEFFHDGQIVLDVGAGAGKDGKMQGDLNVEKIKESGSINDLTYTPVPGGIGSVTTSMLLRNIIKAAAKKITII